MGRHGLTNDADPEVLDEVLTVRCQLATCDVEARYRIRSRQPALLALAFVLPSATPVAVKVGATKALVDVEAAPPEALRADDLDPLERRSIERQGLSVEQARFSAPVVAGENTLVVSYRQPLGRQEYGHSYFSKGRFVELFRYELWPLSEWKHAPGFRVEGQVVIHRPAPSWWARTFSTSRTVGCRGSEAISRAAPEQQGDDLRLVFHLVDPIPPRLWCEIADEDLVSKP